MIVYLKYEAAVWVEVDTDVAEVRRVVVDDESMVSAVTAAGADGQTINEQLGMAAEQIASTDLWPSWDCGPRPL